MRWLVFFTIFSLFIFGSTSSSAQVINKNMGGQIFTGEVLINASPQTVWAALMDVQKFCEVMKFEFLSGAKTLKEVGDIAQLKVWSDVCVLVLIHAKPYTELRYTLDPENASYICQKRWLLTPAGNGTKVVIEDRYTESGTQSAESLAAQVKDWDEALSRLKTLSEAMSK